MTVDGGLRSTQWFGATGRTGMTHRSWMRSQGFTPEVFDGRPVAPNHWVLRSPPSTVMTYN